MRRGESVIENAQRVAACWEHHGLALAVAIAAIDDEIDEEAKLLRDMLSARKERRRVLKRAVGARHPETSPRWGGGRRPSAGGPSNELLSLVNHADGAQDAMRRMLREPGQGLRGSPERLSRDDRDLLVGNLHDRLQVVGVLVVDMTAREDEDTREDRMAQAKARARVTDRLSERAAGEPSPVARQASATGGG